MSVGRYSRVTVERRSDDHIYYNCSLYNPSDASVDRIAQFSETREDSIVINPSEYNIAVARFGIPSNTMELFTFVPGAYWVGLTIGADIYLATVASPAADNRIFSIYAFLDAINQAYAAAAANLLAAHPGVITKAPFMIYDNVSGIFSLAYDPLCVSAGVDIYMNSQLYDFFEGFWIEFFGYNLPSHLDVKFMLGDNGNNTYIYPPGVGSFTYLLSSQDAPVPGALFDITGIIITTAALPVTSENVAISGGIASTNGVSASLNILTDFEPEIGRDLVNGIEAVRFQYQPSLYRLLPLQSTIPLRSIDFQILRQRRNGTIEPIYLSPGRGLNIKLLFLKKGLTA